MVSIKDLLQAGKLVWENRQSIQAALKDIRRWWKKQNVLLIGPGGTGKTTLARLLAGEINYLEHSPWDYSESYGIERLRMQKNQSVEMVVLPGQKHRRPHTWESVLNDLKCGVYKGIMLTSSYGHHALTRGGLKTLKPGLSKDRALSEFLDDCRADELSVLRQISDYAKDAPKKLWLLSVVTKQDIWHPLESQVRNHYCDGEYFEILERLMVHRGPERFRHEIELVSLLICNYLGSPTELLKKNVAGYDMKMQIESVRGLFNTIAQLMVWEAER